MYLGEPLFDRHELTVRAGGHVAVGQHAGKLLWPRLKLQAQDLSKSAFAGFDDGAGVMGDQPAQHGVCVLGVAQVTGAVECVQACHVKVGCVADVVQPRGSLQQIRVRAENSRQAMGPGGDTLDVCPAAGERFLQERLGVLLRPGCQCGHAAQARRLGGTFTDVAGRPKDVLPGVTSRHPAMLA